MSLQRTFIWLGSRGLKGGISNLDEILAIPIPEEISQKHKDDLDHIELPIDKHGNKMKSYNLYRGRNKSGYAPFQNKDFSEEMIEAYINI